MLRLGPINMDVRPKSPEYEPVPERACASLASLVTLPCFSGDSKLWSQLNSVERQSAEWLGYDEQRWQVRSPAISRFFGSLFFEDLIFFRRATAATPGQRQILLTCMVLHWACSVFLA